MSPQKLSRSNNYQLLITDYLPRQTRVKAGRPPSGFTLLEILVIVVILSIVGFISFFAYQQYLEKQKLTQTTELIITHSQDAQNNPALVKNGSKYGITYQTNQLKQFIYQPSQIQSSYILPQSITLYQINLTDLNNQPTNQIIFAKLTGQPDAHGELIIYSTHYQTTITISPLGHLSSSEITKR